MHTHEIPFDQRAGFDVRESFVRHNRRVQTQETSQGQRGVFGKLKKLFQSA